MATTPYKLDRASFWGPKLVVQLINISYLETVDFISVSTQLDRLILRLTVLLRLGPKAIFGPTSHVHCNEVVLL